MIRQGEMKKPPETARLRRKFGVFCAGVAVAGLLQVTGLPSLSDFGFGGIENAEAQRVKREKPKTRKSGTLTDKVAKKMQEAYDAMLEENYAEALAILNRILQGEIKPYDRARVLELIGSIYANEGDYKRAIQVFEEARRLKVLEDKRQSDLLMKLGQLYLAEDRVDDAIAALEEWFVLAGDTAGPTAYFALAQAYAIKENYRRALELAEQGMVKARATDNLRETWFRFTAAMYYQNNKIKEMQNLLREMVGLFPGKAQYWSQLSATYAILGDETTSYYFRIMMYIQDLLKKSTELNALGSLHIFYETPIRGARVMEKGFSDEILIKKSDNYEMLSLAYSQAREWKKSIAPLRKAAGLSEDGDLYIRLCQLYVFDREYAKGEAACVKGINKGDLKDPGNAWMLLGTARYSLDKLEDARKAFVNAARYDKTKKSAQNWINFLDREIKREEQRKARAKAEAEAS